MATILRTRAVISGETGLPGLTTFYWLASSPDNTTATAVLSGVRSYFEAAKAHLSPGSVVTYNTAVDVLSDTSGTLVTQLTASAQTQTSSTGSNDSPAVCMLGLSLITGVVVNGRLLRGRTFFGPCDTAAFNTSGVPSSSAKTALESGGNALLAVSAADLAVWHRPTNGSGGSAQAVTGVAASSKVWVLRSRRD